MSKSSVGNSSVGELEVVTKGLSNINTKKTRKFLKDTEGVFNNGIRDGLIDSNAGFLSFLSSYVLGNWDDFRLKYKFDSYMESILKRNKIDVRKKRRGKKVVLDLSPKFESMIRVILVEMMGVKDEHFSKFFEHIKEALFRISQAINAREKGIKKFESGGLNVRDGALEYLGKTIGYEDELNSLSSGFNWISKIFGYDSKPRSKSEIRKHPHFHIGRIGTDYAKRGVYGWFNWATGTYIPFEYTARFCLSVIVLVLYMTMGEVKIKLFKIRLDSLDYLIHEGVISGKEGGGPDLDESDLDDEIVPVNEGNVVKGLDHLNKIIGGVYDDSSDTFSQADTEIVSSSSESGISTTDQVCSSDEDSSSFCDFDEGKLIGGFIDSMTISGKGDGFDIPSDSKDVFDVKYDKFHKHRVPRKFTTSIGLLAFLRDYSGDAVDKFRDNLMDKHLDDDEYVNDMPNQMI